MKNTLLYLCLLALPYSWANAASVSIPLQLSAGYLERQALRRIFVQPQQTFVAWNDGSGCNHLVLSDPDMTSSASGIQLRMSGDGRVGSPVGELCIPLFPWTGFIDVLLRPVAAGDSVHLEVVDSKLTGLDGKPDVRSTIWDWTKQRVHPQLSAIEVDFGKPLAELRAAVPFLFPGADANRIQRILSTLTVSEAASTPSGISMTLQLTVPDAPERAEPTPEPALTPAESAQLEELFKYWDVFVTLVAKHAAIAAADPETREQLLAILLDARHHILEALTADPRPAGRDPVRRLFLDTWKELAPVLRRISMHTRDEATLNLVGFIGAVDALKAIDAVGPNFNLDISTDGLRRLARLIVPGDAQDPLRYDEEVDPELRRLFDFGPPPQVPEPEAPQPTTGSWFINSAWAAGSWDRSTLFKLDQWIPTPDNIHGYLVRVRWLLEDSVYKILRDRPLDDKVEPIFEPLMLAAAWQETCWRQFVETDGQRQPLRSSIGAVGIMQVSPRVWRGFYQPKALAWNINYNAIAGGEILHHYLTHYAIRKQEHEKTRNLHNLARATYAAYNGGPGHLTRYREAKTPENLKRIDRGFWQKYETIRGGDSLAVIQCYG